MKKILAVLLAVMLTATMLPFCVFAVDGDANDTDGYDGNFNPPNTGSAQNLSDGSIDTLGALFTTVGPTTRIAVGCPSWNDNIGSLTVTLWKWNTDYETTKKDDPIQKQEFVDFEDNEHLGFDFSPALAAGTYFIEVSDGYDDGGGLGVGVWGGPKWPGQAVFVNGEYNDAMSIRMTVNYETQPEGEVYGELPEFDKPKSPLGGDGMLPYPGYVVMKEDGNADALAIVGTGIEGSVTEEGNLLLTVAPGGDDPQYGVDFSIVGLRDTVPCKEYPVLALRVKCLDSETLDGEIFFYTTTVPGAAGGYSGQVVYDHENSDWQTVYVDGRANPKFVENALNGDVWQGIRFDVLTDGPQEEFKLEVAWMAFFESTEAAMAFDGDFSALPTAEPTEAPTPTPEATATPAATPTAAPTTAPTTAPTEEKGGCGSVISGSFAVVAVAAGSALLLRKKRR